MSRGAAGADRQAEPALVTQRVPLPAARFAHDQQVGSRIGVDGEPSAAAGGRLLLYRTDERESHALPHTGWRPDGSHQRRAEAAFGVYCATAVQRTVLATHRYVARHGV